MSRSLKLSKNQIYLFSPCDIEIDMELPIVVKTDNIGAMFMVQNVLTGLCIRHVDTRYHFIKESVEKGTVKINLVSACDKEGDVHWKKFLGEEENDTCTFRDRKGVKNNHHTQVN
jgi:hypothetical protein